MLKQIKNATFLSLGIAFLVPFSLVSGFSLKAQNTSAESSYSVDYLEKIDVQNGSFTEGANPYATGTFTGWNIIDKESRAKGMIIDVGNTFSKYNQNTYILDQNPGKLGNDDKIMMINSKDKTDDKDNQVKKGYSSNKITLKSNSYYKFSISALAALNGSSSTNVRGSIYISGLTDDDGKETTLAIENFSNTTWVSYYFFLATGDKQQEITVDLYLGSKTSLTYGGAVFFDEVTLERYAQNTFYKTCQQFGYQGSDGRIVNNGKEGNVIFLNDGLKSQSSLIDMTDYNFDFESPITSDNTLGEWKITQNSIYGHALVLPVGRSMQPTQFKEITKSDYPFAGNNLSYNPSTKKENSQALVLYTNPGYSTKFTIESKAIDIKAHGIYKFSLYMKVSQLKSGSFYVTIKENDTIYQTYNFDENFYELASASSTGYSSNETNLFTNDYQKIDFFVKGHAFYDTSVNLQLSLGNNDTEAQGCVFVDDISMQYATNEEFTNASNKLELKSFSSQPEFTNGYFNSTENEKKELTYPVKASGWNLTQDESDKLKQEAGVVYLYNKETYKNMYENKDYAWYGIYPGSPDGFNAPNNVYMLFNQHQTYQTLTSAAYELAANGYYKISFDYYTLSTLSKNAKITVEVVDETGIVLYKQKDISSEQAWTKQEIYFHTAENTANKVSVKISLGEKDETVGGIVYLDNFEVNKDITADQFNAALQGVDLTDYLLNLDPEGTIGTALSNSTAYSFNIENTYDGESITNKYAEGGIVKGKDNVYGVEADGNMLVVTTRLASKATLKSNYNFTLEADKYYRLTFDLRTIFNDGADKATTKEHICKYGVSVGLNGYNLIEKLIANEKFNSYTIYFKSSQASTPNFIFSLNSDCMETLGSAFLKDINFTVSTEDEYKAAQDSSNYKKTVFTSTLAETSDDKPEDDKPTTETTPDSTKWLLIPSIITGLAVVIAIIGYLLRHIKIKKIEKIKQEEYDRKISVDHDIIAREAQKRRDEEASKYRQLISELESEREQLDTEHKEAVKEARNNYKGKITKETEREFKQYANKSSRINEKIDILKEQLNNLFSAEYILSLERKIASEEEEKLKADFKAKQEKENKNSEEK